jgi:hypothetical protein
MKQNSSWKVAAGIAVAVAVAGGGAAIATASKHGTTTRGTAAPAAQFASSGAGAQRALGFHQGAGQLEAAATYLGLTTAQLQTELQSGKTLAQVADATKGKSAAGLIAALVADAQKQLAAAVTAGKLTQAQADAMSARLKDQVTAIVNGSFGAGRDHGFGFGHGGAGQLDAAATYLGLTATQLQTALQSGKTLAQVADATKGKSAAGLIAALVASEQKELAAAVTAGKLTQAQADAMSAQLKDRVTAIVNGSFGAGRDHGFGFGHGGAGQLDAAATYLGLTAAQLQTALQSGKTLAQIADATKGKSAAGLIAALVASEQKELAAAVSAGKLTQAQADAMSTQLKQRVTDLVNGVHSAPGFGGHGFGGPPGGAQGFVRPNGAPGFGGPPAGAPGSAGFRGPSI